jgi:hypothetical protein
VLGLDAAADAPDDPRPSDQAGHQTADQVGVVHPGVDDVRLRPAEVASEAHEASRRQAPGGHLQSDHLDAVKSKLLSDGSERAQ